MSIASFISGLTGTSHGAISTRAAGTSASAEMQTLFSKLHMDAIASMNDSTTDASTASTSTSASNSSSTATTDGVTSLVHGLRHLLDGGIEVAKDARSVAKAYTGAGAGALATQVLSKLG